MILVSGGDSFIWGSELSDSYNDLPGGYSLHTYPAIIANQYHIDYVCAAYPGNANSAISRMIIDTCSLHKDVFLLVTWTFAQRAEFLFGNKWVSINCHHNVEKDFSEQYFKHVGDNEYYEIFSTLKEIIFLQNFCQVNSIPFLFTTSDNYFYLHENYNRRCDATLTYLHNQIDWNKWVWFPASFQSKDSSPRGFYQWAIENKYKVGPQGHPLEDAHRDAAKIIKGKFNEMVQKPY